MFNSICVIIAIVVAAIGLWPAWDANPNSPAGFSNASRYLAGVADDGAPRLGEVLDLAPRKFILHGFCHDILKPAGIPESRIHDGRLVISFVTSSGLTSRFKLHNRWMGSRRVCYTG